MDPLTLPAAAALADLACPERCAACAAVVARALLFCHACRALVNVLGPPECAVCGLPRTDRGTCVPCRAPDGDGLRRARAVVAYRGVGAVSPVAQALASFKYGRVTRLARRLAAAMAARVSDPTIAVVVPVPLHPTRLRARGFNQSALLARHVARALDRPVALAGLVRTRATPSQTALTAVARAANVAGAFAVRDGRALRAATVLLVDDVWTSGATLRAAAAALHAGGAVAVDAITFARVL